MRRLKTPMHFVASAEYDSENSYFLLDKPLKVGKIYLIRAYSDPNGSYYTFLMDMHHETRLLYDDNGVAFESTSSGSELTTYLYYGILEPLYLRVNGELFADGDAVCYVYEIDI